MDYITLNKLKMRTKLLSTCILLLILSSAAFACDICGSSPGNYFIGPFPQFGKHFFGTRYTFRSFNSRVDADATQFSKDFYQTIELWGGWSIGKKWQVIAFIPYNINRQASDDGIKSSKGLGDVSVIVNYKILNKTGNKNNNGISQQLWIGGGLKLPTGNFNVDPNDIINPDANNEPGTGSVDFLLNAIYAIHINKWGVNSSINYKVNQSAREYQFGNRFNSSIFLFRTLSRGQTTFNPNAGLLYENLRANKLNNLKVDNTGGHALLASAGVEINFSRIAIGFNAQLPVSQNFSNNQTTTKIRGMLHLSYTF